METQKMWIPYPSSITDIAAANNSFDACVIRVCYTGVNRNKSSISRQAIEKALPTIYNCPIVCNYNIHEDTIGGHDMEVIRTEEGLKLVNLTDAIGVIPSGAQHRWEQIETDGEMKEYFCIDGLLWKRSSAYEKIKTDGITAQSMEIDVTDGRLNDGVFEIEGFTFTAFCLLGDGIEPCFEDASLQTFSLAEYKRNFTRMMEDFKTEYEVSTAKADDIDNASMKGGNDPLKIEELMEKYGLSPDDVTFDATGMDESELERAFAEIRQKKFGDDPPAAGDGDTGTTGGTGSSDTGGSGTGGAGDGSGSGSGDGSGSGSGGGSGSGTGGGSGSGEGSGEETPATDTMTEDEDIPSGQRRRQYTLTAQQMLDELCRALSSATVYDEDWGRNVPRYWMVDYDDEAMEVYAEDRTDGKLYGMKYEVNGDAVSVDFDSRVRKKISFVDFEDDAPENGAAVFDMARRVIGEELASMRNEVNSLREFKLAAETAARKAALDGVFAAFGDLVGNDAFEALKADPGDMSAEQVEEKCFALRGKMASVKFSLDETNKPIRLPVEQGGKNADEPYGGVFMKYGIGAR